MWFGVIQSLGFAHKELENGICAHKNPEIDLRFRDLGVSKILSNSKFELVDENLLESIDIVLLVENEHRLLVVNRIDRPEA